MHTILAHRWLSLIVLAVLLLVAVVAWQVLYIKYHGTYVPAPEIPRETETFGTGAVIKYAVIGDSTSIAQGADYTQGVARMTAEYLAKTHKVELANYGISGAQVDDVLQKQVDTAAATKPDLVLVFVGANDVTHLTSLGSIQQGMTSIITKLQTANPEVKIVLTGSPAMGSVGRFAPPTQWIAAFRTKQVNDAIAKVAAEKSVVLIPLAEQTAGTFKHNPQLFAADNFHPNAAGYAVWEPIVENGLRAVGY